MESQGRKVNLSSPSISAPLVSCRGEEAPIRFHWYFSKYDGKVVIISMVILLDNGKKAFGRMGKAK